MTGSNDVKLAFEGKILEPQEHRGQRWFLAKDVCQILELRSAKGATRLLDDDEVCLLPTATAGGIQNLIAVNESGAYHLTFTSRKPVAKRFRRWVTEQVLPQIRRTGEYRPDAGAQADNGSPKPEISAADLRLLAELKEVDPFVRTVLWA